MFSNQNQKEETSHDRVIQSLTCVQLFVTHGLQHTRLPCPQRSLRACSDSCPLSWRCHPAISSLFHLLLLPSIFPALVRVIIRGSGACFACICLTPMGSLPHDHRLDGDIVFSITVSTGNRCFYMQAEFSYPSVYCPRKITVIS